jgi:hypothetical protein
MIEVKLNEFKKVYTHHLDLVAKSHVALYEALATAYQFAKLALESKNRPDFEKLCADLGEPYEVGTKDNVYLPVAKVLFRRDKQEGSGTEAEPIAYKYAKVIRHLMENGVAERDVVTYIQSFEYKSKDQKDKKTYTKLAGIYKADAEAHADEETRGGSNSNQDTLDILTKRLVKISPIASFDLNGDEKFTHYENYVVMVGDLDGTTINVREILNKPDVDMQRAMLMFKFVPTKAAGGPKKTMWQSAEPAAAPIVAEPDEKGAA